MKHLRIVDIRRSQKPPIQIPSVKSNSTKIFLQKFILTFCDKFHVLSYCLFRIKCIKCNKAENADRIGLFYDRPKK